MPDHYLLALLLAPCLGALIIAYGTGDELRPNIEKLLVATPAAVTFVLALIMWPFALGFALRNWVDERSGRKSSDTDDDIKE